MGDAAAEDGGEDESVPLPLSPPIIMSFFLSAGSLSYPGSDPSPPELGADEEEEEGGVEAPPPLPPLEGEDGGALPEDGFFRVFETKELELFFLAPPSPPPPPRWRNLCAKDPLDDDEEVFFVAFSVLEEAD